MSHGTSKIYGHGFVVNDAPRYLDEACKSAPHAVFKGKAAAVKKADSEALILADVPEVEGVVAAQIPGFEGLWFLIYIYTDERAAKSLEFITRMARQDAARIAATANRA